MQFMITRVRVFMLDCLLVHGIFFVVVVIVVTSCFVFSQYSSLILVLCNIKSTHLPRMNIGRIGILQ